MAKIKTITETLPAHWASFLINGDNSGLSDNDEKEIQAYFKNSPELGQCIDCTEETEVKIFDGLLCETLEFTFYLRVYEEKAGGLCYLTYPAQIVDKPLPWQKMGLSYTTSGYGAKIPTTKMALILGRFYRIYCTQYSNAGTTWINYNGKKVIL